MATKGPPSSNAITFGIAGFAAVIGLITCGLNSLANCEARPAPSASPATTKTPKPPASAVAKSQPSSATMTAAEKALRAEPKVKDLAWSYPYLNVGVADDGSRRDGYAMYICEVLREHRASDGVTVVINDIRDVSKRLGRAACGRT